MTGLRRGELLGLRWSDIDLDESRLVVRRQVTSVGGTPTVSQVKTKRSERSIDLDAGSVEVLRRHRIAQAEERLSIGSGWQDTNHAFTAESGSLLHPDVVSKTFARLVKASELPRIRFHDLRHSHATHLIAAGTHVKVISDRLGHASVSFTMDRYGHVLPNLQSGAASAVAGLVDGPAH